MKGGAVRGIVVPRAAAKAEEASHVAAATGTSVRLIPAKQLDAISETTGYMTQEEAARHVQEVLASHVPKAYKSREEREREKRAREKQAVLERKQAGRHAAKDLQAQGDALAAAASGRPLTVRFLRKSLHAEIGEPVQVVGVSKSGKALRTASGGACALAEEGSVWEYC